MGKVIDFKEVIQSMTDKANSANLNDEEMTAEEKEQEAVVNIVCHLTNTELKEPQDDELSLTIRLADLANICEGYMKLLKQVGEIQKAAKELFGE